LLALFCYAIKLQATTSINISKKRLGCSEKKEKKERKRERIKERG
jgi:hypothetical protein